jgi:O-methyltransferase involved in polyketide biosynthesis
MSTDRISPTAHYTAAVWARHGLDHPAVTAAVRPRLFRWTTPVIAGLARVTGSPTIEQVLLQRHHGLDTLLRRAIADGFTQVLEVPGGLSSRGPRFLSTHPELRYVEGDLPAMAARKRSALLAGGFSHPGHAVVDIDLLAESGPTSLGGVLASHLDPTQPTVVIMEGLLNYFDEATVAALWGRIVRTLGPLPRLRYLADMRVRVPRQGVAERVFLAGLSTLARGTVAAHFEGEAGAAAALSAAGFEDARVMPAVADPEAGAGPEEQIRMQLLDARLGG